MYVFVSAGSPQYPLAPLDLLMVTPTAHSVPPADRYSRSAASRTIA